jgi:predicted DsbA family dithiol-disulfide isomerase
LTKLDILSDPICPWCLIGKTFLDRALEARPEHNVIVEWHPFMLNPTMPADGMDRRAYLEAKFGGKDAAVRTYAQIEKAAQDAGLSVSFEKIGRTPSTIDAHRLIWWAGVEGYQNAVVDRLFNAYFREGLDIGDHEVLVSIAKAVGMDHAAIAELLRSQSEIDFIQQRDHSARERGVSGVPCFIVENRHVVLGAQPTSLWEKVIDDLAQLHETTNNP